MPEWRNPQSGATISASDVTPAAPYTQSPNEHEFRLVQRRTEGASAGASSGRHADVTSTNPAFVIRSRANITCAHMGHASTSPSGTVCASAHRGYEVEWARDGSRGDRHQKRHERQLGRGLTRSVGGLRFQSRVDAWYEEYGDVIRTDATDGSRALEVCVSRSTTVVPPIGSCSRRSFDEGSSIASANLHWCPMPIAISDEEIDWRSRPTRSTTSNIRQGGGASRSRRCGPEDDAVTGGRSRARRSVPCSSAST